jgi:hypothetical protein
VSGSASKARSNLTHEQIVVLATYLAGGDAQYADTEDVAMATAKIAPGRFSWVKYPDQINIENVRRRLLDATRPESGGYVTGSQRKGWLLTESGLAFCKKHEDRFLREGDRQQRVSRAEQSWVGRERARMLKDKAFEKWASGKIEVVLPVEAERFFRIDDYMNTAERTACISRAAEAFRADETLRAAIEAISKLVRDR